MSTKKCFRKRRLRVKNEKQKKAFYSLCLHQHEEKFIILCWTTKHKENHNISIYQNLKGTQKKSS